MNTLKKGIELFHRYVKHKYIRFIFVSGLNTVFGPGNYWCGWVCHKFGLLTKEHLFEYALIADKHLGDGIRLSYHAHNNLQQAFSNARAMCEGKLET